MPVNRNHILIFLLLVCGSCIDPFEPDIEEVQEVLVINGVITDQPGVHYLIVSKSTPYNDPSFNPVSGCVVTVMDDLGNMVFFQEGRNGVYEAYLDESFLSVGKAYALHTVTRDGQEYRSDYDTLLACPPIDSIYFEVMSQGTADPNLTYHGLQFYNDVTGSPGGASNFRWLLNETWQYTSPYTAEYIWFGGQVLPFLEDTISTCYMSDPVRSVYSASTMSLSENRLRRNTLNYVSNQSPRLTIKYSLLVEQQSLTNNAFAYWDKLKGQVGGGGGLYETQPSSTIGNIYNVNTPETKVLGCFYATQIQQKRLTVENDFEFDVESFRCRLDTIASLDELGASFPHYLFSLLPLGPGPPYATGSQRCFDCTIIGGVTEKPDYW